jgi:transcriptional regulator with XRE-family HTH domain
MITRFKVKKEQLKAKVKARRVTKPKEKIYGNRIKELLIKKEMSDKELSDISGVITSHLSRIINGKRMCISLPVAFKIAEALNEPIENVFMHKKPITSKKIEDDAN